MKVKINIDECIGCGVCAQLCPEIFKIDDNAGKCIIDRQQNTDDIFEKIKETEEACPVGAIKTEE